MATLPSLPPMEGIISETDEFRRLLANPYKSELERLLSQARKTDFEKLLEREVVPRSNYGGAARVPGQTWTASGARWLGYAGLAVMIEEELRNSFRQAMATYYDAEKYQEFLREQWDQADNLQRDVSVLRDADLNAYTDALIEIQVMFKTEIRTLKRTDKKRAYRMATSRKNG